MEELTFQQFITTINRMYKEEDDIYRRVARHSGLSDAAFWILYAMEMAQGPATQTEIGSTLVLSKQTINSALRKLEGDGTVYLEGLGGRRKRACLTEKGQTLAERTVVRLIEIENGILASWPKAQLEQYLELTEQYMIALREKVREL